MEYFKEIENMFQQYPIFKCLAIVIIMLIAINSYFLMGKNVGSFIYYLTH